MSVSLSEPLATLRCDNLHSSHDRFLIEQHDEEWFLYDSARSQPLNENGFVCIASFDRQIDALIECLERNEREEKEVL